MKGIIALSAALALSGCASAPEYAESDFTYEDMSGFAQVGVRATSKSTGKTIEAYGNCSDQGRDYVIRLKSDGVNPNYGGGWNAFVEGLQLDEDPYHYKDEKDFIAAIPTLEMVGPRKTFSAEPRIKIANSNMQRIPDLCKQKQAEVLAYIHNAQGLAENKERQENERLISDVVNRTGVKPMLGGDNHKDLNNLALLFRTTGTDPHEGKFVWAEAGDYEAVQILDGKVLMLSRFSPSFPAIIIFMDTKPPKGKSSVSLFKAPLKLIGTSTYETVLGESRQAIVFKAI